MSIPPVFPPFRPDRTRIANLVPFTYRDTMTMLEKIEALQKYVETFVPEVNVAVATLIAEFEATNEAQMVEFDIRFTDFVDQINQHVTELDNLVESFGVSSTEIQNAITQANLFIDDRDQFFADLVLDPSSETGQEIGARMYELFGDRAITFPEVNALMVSSKEVKHTVQLPGFNYNNDGIEVHYAILNNPPTETVAEKIGVPLPTGTWAAPTNLSLYPSTDYDYKAIKEMMKIAQTYIEAGSDLIYDTQRHSPLTAPQPVHSLYTAPYAITCSSFIQLVLGGYQYSSSTYVANENTRPYTWGIDWAASAGTLGPWQAHRLLSFFYRNGQAALHDPRQFTPKVGDILFFSKQEPEGPGTTGRYFMNCYHVALYAGKDSSGVERLIHAYGASSGNGVKNTEYWASLKEDFTFYARPNLGREESNSSAPQTVTVPALTGALRYWTQGDMGYLNFDGATLKEELTGTRDIWSTNAGELLYDVTEVLMDGAGNPIRVRIGGKNSGVNAGKVSIYAYPSLPIGTALHGTLKFPLA